MVNLKMGLNAWHTVGLRRICCETALRHQFLACFRLDMFNIRPKTGQFWRSQADFSRRLPKSDSLLDGWHRGIIQRLDAVLVYLAGPDSRGHQRQAGDISRAAGTNRGGDTAACLRLQAEVHAGWPEAVAY
jgi:hypothetical protein